MQNRTFGILAVAVATSLIASCANLPNDTDSGRERLRGSDCFSSDRVSDYKAISKDLLLVWSPNRHCAYAVGIGIGCSGIRSASGIAFSDRDGRICGFPDDKVILAGAFSEDCSITAVEKLTPERLLILAPKYARENDKGEIVNCGRTMNAPTE